MIRLGLLNRGFGTTVGFLNSVSERAPVLAAVASDLGSVRDSAQSTSQIFLGDEGGSGSPGLFSTLEEKVSEFEGLPERVRPIGESLQSATAEVEGKLQDAQARVQAEFGQLEQSEQLFAGLATRVSESAERVRERATAANENVRDAADSILDQLSNLESTGSAKLDKVLDQVRDANSGIAGSVKDGIQAFASGLIDYQEFLQKYGDIQIAIDGQIKSIQEALQGADLSGVEDRLRRFVENLRSEERSVKEILTAISRDGTNAAQTVVELVKQFKAGGVDGNKFLRLLDKVAEQLKEGSALRELIEQLQEAVSDGGNVLETLEDALGEAAR